MLLVSIGVCSYYVNDYLRNKWLYLDNYYAQSLLFLTGSILLLIIEVARIVFSVCNDETNNVLKCISLVLVIADNLVFLFLLVLNFLIFNFLYPDYFLAVFEFYFIL